MSLPSTTATASPATVSESPLPQPATTSATSASRSKETILNLGVCMKRAPRLAEELTLPGALPE
jgi:hypothetical protein